ncbi:MAG: MHS family MFS transporter [Rhodospirillaceae bacterium]|nr:MHS family MFS transporter [Rhodospirillaceae bacterium]
MVPADTAAGGLSDAQHKKEMTKAVIASTIGTAIEWYDFFLYSIATGLVFAHLYFPQSEPLIGTLQAFSIFAVGFIARPIGAAIFGHYGDRIGRKATLVATLMLMGFATFAVALVPGYEVIGIWGAVILTILRFLQGVGVGGEWGGSVLMAMEWTKGSKNRGFVTSWPQFGVPVGLFLANLSVLAASALSGEAFMDWGWRIPFFLSLLLVGVGLYIRLGILETPTFRRLKAENKLEKNPMLEVIKRQPKEILVATFARTSENACFYIFTAFILSYGTQHLHMSRDFLLQAVLVASIFSFFWIPLSGWISDRIGRKRMYLISVVVTGIFAFIYFAMLETAAPAMVFAAIVLSLLPHNMMYGPQAAMIAESFTGRLRYSGSSLGYQLTAIIAGGPAPIIAAALLAKYNTGFAIAFYLLACTIVSIIATLMLKDRTHASIDEEYEGV